MSDPVDASDLKGGHAPAVKVGGMRVTQDLTRHKSDKERKTEGGETVPKDAIAEKVYPNEKEERALLAAAIQPEKLDFHTEAVQAKHDKPKPNVQYPHNPKPRDVHHGRLE